MPVGTQRPASVGLVGHGVIGAVHHQVIDHDDRLRLAFIADPRLCEVSAPSSGCPHFADLDEALNALDRGLLPQPELVVIATPTSAHLHHTSQVLARTTSLVLSEKPLTGDATALSHFERDHAETGERLRVVNHFGFSPEVEWGVNLSQARDWGAPQFVLSTFNDPYASKDAAGRSTYVSSWIDSGPNQVAVLDRFATARDVTGHWATEDGTRSCTEITFDGGVALVSSNWHTGYSTKQTSLRWSHGRELLLDHTAMTAIAVEKGRPIAHFGQDSSADRKIVHYAAMYDALLTGRSPQSFDVDFARRLAALLERASTMSSSAPPPSWQ